MANISNAELALLSLIAEHPRHAYEIEQVIEERNIRYWTELGFSSIYRILTGLERSGLLAGQMQEPKGRGPARKVYSLTPDGKKVWQQAALDSLAKPSRSYSSFLLGLDNLGELPPDKAVEAIRIYLSGQQTVYEQLNFALENHPKRKDFFIRNFFDYLLKQLAAEVDWLRDFYERLETHYQSEKE